MEMSHTAKVILEVFLSVLSGFTCAVQARRQGRDPRFWFIWGFLFSIFAFLYLVMVQKKRRPVRSSPKVQKRYVPPQPQEPLMLWYYLDHNHTVQGPISHFALKSAVEEKKISLQTYVWNETFTDWKKYQETTTS